MFSRFLIVVVLIISTFIFVNAQNKKKLAPSAGIINGKAINLVKPEYPKIAKDLCVGGKVKVETLLYSTGEVIKAKAISGDELLREVSVKAVKAAKFAPVIGEGDRNFYIKGIIVYNFDSFVRKKCVEAGILNNKAVNLPIPALGNIIHPNHLRVPNGDTVKVRVLVGLHEGKVVSAHAVTGHPLLRNAFTIAASKATFTPFYHGQVIFAKGMIIYKVRLDGTVSTNIKSQK
jgi:hypothetical protein